MMNVMIEDSQWLDSFQNRVLAGSHHDQMDHRVCSVDRLDSNETENTVHLTSTGMPWRHGLNLEANCSNINRSNVLELANRDEESLVPTTRKRARAPSDKVEDRNVKHEVAVSQRRCEALPVAMSDELPAPEFVKCNRSTIAAETLRLVQSSMCATSVLAGNISSTPIYDIKDVRERRDASLLSPLCPPAWKH